jgi:mRNA-degrading endonuclease HigB of HigAB toxin-antitoxin module
MRFLGQFELVEFLRAQPSETERIQAWLSEIRNRHWSCAEALSADFRSVDMSKPPLAIFQLRDPPLQIDTLIDFRTSIVLLRGIQKPKSSYLVSQSSQPSSTQ